MKRFAHPNASTVAGGGRLTYKNVKASCNDMIWFPDSVNFNTVFESYKDMYLNQIENYSSGRFPEDRFGSTTHISVIDKEGNASSATTTNGEGCGSILPEAGFMMNNMLGEEDLNPDGFFLHTPGLRLPTMMAPTIVLKNGKPVLVTGSAGSNRSRSVVIQMIVNTLCNGIA